MKKILEITRASSGGRFIGKDAAGKTSVVQTEKELRVGQSVLVVNDIVVGVVQTSVDAVFEV